MRSLDADFGYPQVVLTPADVWISMAHYTPSLERSPDGTNRRRIGNTFRVTYVQNSVPPPKRFRGRHNMTSEKLGFIDDVDTLGDRPIHRPDKLMRLVVGVRIVAMGALFCTVAVGAVYAIVTGGQLPAGFDLWAAIGGGTVAGAVKVLASTPV